MDLDHRTPECTGEWRRESGRYWRCSECHLLYYGALDVRYAALRENAMGNWLKLLASEGQRRKHGGEELPEGRDR